MKKPLCGLLGIALLITFGCKAARVDKIVEGGVETVLNHQEPYRLKGQPSKLNLIEERRIDLEKSEYAALGIKEPGFVEADPKGDIFVVEQFPVSGIFIYELGPRGEFIRSFGRLGQGPGEVQSVYDLSAKEDGQLLVSDIRAGKLLEFDSGANLVKETKVDASMREFVPLANGNFLARRNPKTSDEAQGMYLCLYDSQFNELKKLDFCDMSAMTPGKKTFGTMLSFYWRATNDRIYVGNEQRGYEIWVYDLDGNLLKRIKKEYTPVAYPEEFRKQTEELAARQPAMNLVPRQENPPFNSFFLDDAGRLYVMTYERGSNPDDYIHDVFNKDGILIARVPLGTYGILARSLNQLHATAANGLFYRLRFKENGFPELIISRMAWE